jgi:hypothetical protein
MDSVNQIERSIMKWLVQNYQRRTLRRAVHQAYAAFARTYPDWVASLFDEHFVTVHLLPLMQRATETGDKVTAAQVAELWSQQVSMLPTRRHKHSTRILPIAAHFLCMVADELAQTQVGRTPTQLVETAAG